MDIIFLVTFIVMPVPVFRAARTMAGGHELGKTWNLKVLPSLSSRKPPWRQHCIFSFHRTLRLTEGK
jgi:hypothetical protein